MFIPKQLNRLTARDFQSDIYHPQQNHMNLAVYEHQVYSNTSYNHSLIGSRQENNMVGLGKRSGFVANIFMLHPHQVTLCMSHNFTMLV